MKKRFARKLITLAVAAGFVSLAAAQTSSSTTTTTTTSSGGTATTSGSTATSGSTTTSGSTATPSTSGAASTKLASSFSDFAGSTANSTALVDGLRTGKSITLTSTSTSTTSGTGGSTTTMDSATFTPPTKPMGYGNVKIALSLARAELAAQDITNPTPQQLQGALMGGTSSTGTQTQGILQMRASGMGWGQIANTMGFKLGAVMSGHVPTNAGTSATASTSGTSTAAGGRTTNMTAHGKSSGIVTAGGGSMGGSGTDISHGGGNGVATAGGGMAGAHGAMSAQGATHGQGGGQGHGKL